MELLFRRRRRLEGSPEVHGKLKWLSVFRVVLLNLPPRRPTEKKKNKIVCLGPIGQPLSNRMFGSRVAINKFASTECVHNTRTYQDPESTNSSVNIVVRPGNTETRATASFENGAMLGTFGQMIGVSWPNWAGFGKSTGIVVALPPIVWRKKLKRWPGLLHICRDQSDREQPS